MLSGQFHQSEAPISCPLVQSESKVSSLRAFCHCKAYSGLSPVLSVYIRISYLNFQPSTNFILFDLSSSLCNFYLSKDASSFLLHPLISIRGFVGRSVVLCTTKFYLSRILIRGAYRNAGFWSTLGNAVIFSGERKRNGVKIYEKSRYVKVTRSAQLFSLQHFRVLPHSAAQPCPFQIFFLAGWGFVNHHASINESVTFDLTIDYKKLNPSVIDRAVVSSTSLSMAT